MTPKQIAKIKQTWWYKVFRPTIQFLQLQYDLHKQHKKFKWMQKQMLMIDPCTRKRQKYWIRCGANIEGNVDIGAGVYFDAPNAHHIHIEDGVWIASQCLILCHKRNLNDYKCGDDCNTFPYIIEDVVLKRKCHIGMRSMILPGVTIGEGAIIGAGSLVTKDIPPYSLAIGSPAKVVKYFNSKRNE